MHELSLMQALIDLAEGEARKHGAARISVVRVEIGDLSHVDAQTLRFCFDAAAHGSLAQGARFDIINIPAAGRCLDCGRDVAMMARFDACPECGAHRVQMTRGDDLRLLELEVT
jgi:hydrogenase nickel incorporation protein HypA/HybF